MINLRSSTKLHELTHIALSWAQLLTGTSRPILRDINTPLPHMYPMSWILSIRHFLKTINATLEVETVYTILIQRKNDIFLMDHFLSYTTSPTILKQLNACRIFLDVTLLSDITTEDRQNLSPQFYNGIHSFTNSSKLLYPFQSNPNATAWRHWKNVLHRLTIENTRQLTTPLRHWKCSGPLLLRHWPFLLDHKNNKLFVQLPDKQYSVYTSQNFFVYFDTSYYSISIKICYSCQRHAL